MLLWFLVRPPLLAAVRSVRCDCDFFEDYLGAASFLLLCEGNLWCGPPSTACVGCVNRGSPLLAAVEGV
jgi:hypothetical protein